MTFSGQNFLLYQGTFLGLRGLCFDSSAGKERIYVNNILEESPLGFYRHVWLGLTLYFGQYLALQSLI